MKNGFWDNFVMAFLFLGMLTLLYRGYTGHETEVDTEILDRLTAIESRLEVE